MSRGKSGGRKHGGAHGHGHGRPTRRQFEGLYAKVQGTIDRTGHAVVGVGAGDGGRPQHAYTIGLAAFDLPELLAVGLPIDFMHVKLNEIAAICRRGDVDVFDRQALADALGLAGPYLQLMPVDPSWLPTEMFQLTLNFRRITAAPPTVQMVPSDEEGRFPWDEGCTQPPFVRLWEPRSLANHPARGWRG